jgi:hypothetical protein
VHGLTFFITCYIVEESKSKWGATIIHEGEGYVNHNLGPFAYKYPSCIQFYRHNHSDKLFVQFEFYMR